MTFATLIRKGTGRIHYAGEMLGSTFCGRTMTLTFEWQDDEELVDCRDCLARAGRGTRWGER